MRAYIGYSWLQTIVPINSLLVARGPANRRIEALVISVFRYLGSPLC